MSEKIKTYHPEDYWSEVGERIQQREGANVVAGDDTPYYRYKRRRFLEMLSKVNFEGKRVMEVGHGPGGNLAEVLKRNPSHLTGVDISETMINLAKSNLKSQKILFYKTNGKTLEFPEDSQDIVFSATVLQHNSDEEMMKAMFREMLRVSGGQVILFERIEKVLKGDDLCVGRPVEYYSAIAEEAGFKLKASEFINIQVSYLISGGIRKVFNRGSRQEGERLNKFSVIMQKVTLPITKFLDRVFTAKRDLGMLVFEKVK